ncbi:TPA: hypothetical protein ACWP8B_000001, partial [Klebsiella pneumoniae]
AHPSAVMDIQYSNNNDQQNDILHGVFPDLIGGNPTLAVPLSQQRYGASKTLTMLIHITPNCFNKKQHARCSVSGR